MCVHLEANKSQFSWEALACEFVLFVYSLYYVMVIVVLYFFTSCFLIINAILFRRLLRVCVKSINSIA